MHPSSRDCIESTAALTASSLRAIESSRALIRRSEHLGPSCSLCHGRLRVGDNLTAYAGELAHVIGAEITRRGSR